MKKLSLRMKNKVLWVTVGVLGVIGLGGSAFAESPSLRELLAEKLSEKLVGNLEAALGILPAEEELGLSVIDVSATGLSNLRVGGKRCFGSSSSTYIYRCSQQDVEEWPRTTTTFRIQNTRTTSSTVSRVLFDMSRTTAGDIYQYNETSSTFMLSCGTSTNGFVAYDSAVPPGWIFNAVVIPTGTQAIIDSHAVASSTGSAAGLSTATEMPRGSVIVAPNEYLTCVAQVPHRTTRVCPFDPNSVTAQECEQVTSTRRGWQAVIAVDWEWTEGLGF